MRTRTRVAIASAIAAIGLATAAAPAFAADAPALQNDRNWQSSVSWTYNDWPVGTTIHWQWKWGSAYCLSRWNEGWTTTVSSASDSGGDWAFMTTNAQVWDDCAYYSSHGSWTVTVTTPRGISATATVTLETGDPNIYNHKVTATCTADRGLDCTGGSDSSRPDSGIAPAPRVTISPAHT